MKKLLLVGVLSLLPLLSWGEQGMDEMWGESVVKLRAENAERGQLFNDGNYAMFIHWGLYSQLANKVDGKTYYGIGEWIMNPRMAGIAPEKYKKLAATMNPVNFDAPAIARLAKDAGMKYIIITSKHHDGFAMYDSKSSDFDITDSTPWKKDPMKELAAACRAEGLGFGFYYSHNQDWTFPGGNGGPTTDAEGNSQDFGDYFVKKCLPQVKEITSEYGPIELVWFDTPGKMPKEYVQQLVDVVRKNQPNALISGRAGHNLGDYQSLGDMEVPLRNVPGMWETVDTTNDSWAFAWYDENWKTPKEILSRVVATVARGGTYMLNIGPRGDGSVPQRAADALRSSGKWIRTYPQVVYAVDASPWQHGLAWGDITVKKNKLFLTVFEWPDTGELYLPGLQTEIRSARLLKGSDAQALSFDKVGTWTRFSIPYQAPERFASVIEVTLAGEPKADATWGVDPIVTTYIAAEFAEVSGAEQKTIKWMEKFGEWKHAKQVSKWKADGKATWEVDIAVAGEYQVSLNYAGKDRLVWQIAVEGGQTMRNQQAASANYQIFPMGWLHFDKPGKYKISVSCVEGDMQSASLRGIEFTPVTL